MTWGRICSVRGALARTNHSSLLSVTRISQALQGCDQAGASSEPRDGCPLVVSSWKRYASGVGGSDDGGDNGDAGNSQEKGQWRQWVEQRLKAKEQGPRGAEEESVFPSQSSMLNDTSVSAAFSGPHKLSAEHPVDMAMDDFESRVLGISPKKEGLEDDDFLRELEEIERSATWGATGRRDENELDGEMDEDEDDDEGDEEWEDDRGQVLSDAALAAIVDYDLDDEEKPYQFRPDRYFFPGQKYDPEDLDLSKKPEDLERPPPRFRRRYDANEVLQRADFRNPRYLSNFISETSRILPKRRSSLTAKAQRKVIREIKTARTFGLMPFTSMGKSPFRFLRSRLDEEEGSNINY